MNTREIITETKEKYNTILGRASASYTSLILFDKYIENLQSLERKMKRDGLQPEKALLFHVASASTPSKNTLRSLDFPAPYSVQDFIKQQHFDLVTQPETGAIDYQI